MTDINPAPRRIRTKIKSATALAARLRKLRRLRPGTVVFTNGCFDLLHKGHVNYLERARRLGTLMIVALNSDASIKRLKGPGRPINSLADRLEVLAAVECVDFVTWFGQDTPLALIRRLRPDYLVKGGDWSPAQIVGAPEVLSWGGKVRSLRYIEGKSTTAILKKARSREI